ncbi:competence protein CoiA family protein [Streptomyces sp. CL7]|uniref:competence protein CoiA family protein n=1 Tax=Streptomyces sp. CL7 TaxID=3096006 RepID=UPI002A75FDA1|nr:competence protein CoiA family protein [Streptomyces sp. CL7]WPP33165.1 competence protein CoiA family protein [Streptomyces sp. CL7]
MPSYEDDTRKVQTAVTGRPGSDQPVFLPFDHDDFDGFMRGRSRDDFYCGILLGGCGKKLTAKRYLHKKCHFAHRPPVHCRRAQTGEDSADHLYIGQALQRWLHRQGHQKVNVSYPNLGSGPGGAVELRFGSGTRLIRVQMDRMSLNQWEAIRAQFAYRNVRAQWAYGPNSGIAHNEAKAEGRALRFTCRTEGGTRKVYVGTQHPDHTVELTTLDEWHLTDDGIITPHVTREPPTNITADAGSDMTAQLAFPIVPGRLAFTAAIPADEQNSTGRRLYHADVQPSGSAMTRMRIALPLHAVPPSPHRLNVIESTAHLIPLTASDGAAEPSWLIEAVGFTPLLVRSDPRWPDLRPTPEPPAPPASVTDIHVRAALIERFRKELGAVALSHGLIDWETLVGTTDVAPSDITPADRVRLLIEVDHPRAGGKPVFSSLVVLTGDASGPPPFFTEVLAGLGWKAGLPAAKVADIWAREQRTAYMTTQSSALPVAAVSSMTAGRPSDEELVACLKNQLEGVARQRGMIRWVTLLRKTGVPASAISADDRVRLLAAVDRPYGPGRPVLSCLVKQRGTPGPTREFDRVLTAIGWRPTASVPTAGAAWPVERNRTYAHFRHRPKGATPKPAVPSGSNGLLLKLGITRASAAEALRPALIAAARRQVCVSWETLAREAHLPSGRVSEKERAAVLVAVDRPSAPHGVMLSSLLISANHTPVPYFADILRGLGRPHDLRPIELGRLRKVEQARAFAAYQEQDPG